MPVNTLRVGPKTEHVIYSGGHEKCFFFFFSFFFRWRGKKAFIRWPSYPVVSKRIHVGAVRMQTKLSFQHVGASHSSVSQAACVGMKNNESVK